MPGTALVEHAKLHEVSDDPLEALEYCYAQGWTDGLPVVPPETGRVEAMLQIGGRPPEAVLASHPTTGRECTVLAAATNAVMAGCLPEYFRVVVAALEAMNEPAFNFHASTASTGGSAPLLIVSGPLVEQLEMNAGVNVFGPGNRPNATIGRALRLIILNVFQMTPGLADKSTLGQPAKYSFCIGERSDPANPWNGLNVGLGYPPEVSSVTVFAAGGFHNVENHGASTPEALLETMADAMANLGSITIGQSVVVFSPEHARILGRASWSKAQVREFLFERGHRSVAAMTRVGKYVPRDHEVQGRAAVHRGLGPDDILITVAGGDAGGHSAFIPSWSRTRASTMQSKPIDVCMDCEPE